MTDIAEDIASSPTSFVGQQCHYFCTMSRLLSNTVSLRTVNTCRESGDHGILTPDSSVYVDCPRMTDDDVCARQVR